MADFNYTPLPRQAAPRTGPPNRFPGGPPQFPNQYPGLPLRPVDPGILHPPPPPRLPFPNQYPPPTLIGVGFPHEPPRVPLISVGQHPFLPLPYGTV